MKIPILAAITILSTLIAIPLATHPARAIVAPGLTDPANVWSPVGPDPSIHNLVMQFYSSDTAERNAFETGQLDLMDTGQSGSGVPVSQYSKYVSNPDWLITPTQGSGIYHGVYFNFGSSTWALWGCDFTHGNSACGVEIREAFGHLVDKSRFVTDGPLQGGGVAIADDVPANKANPNGTIFSTPASTQCKWDTLVSHQNCISAFNLAPDPGGFAAVGSPDFCAAVDHLIQATADAPALGLQRDPNAPLDAFGNHCGISPSSPGLANIAAHPMRGMVRSTEPRHTLGLSLASIENKLFANNVVNVLTIGSGGVIGTPIVFSCCSHKFPTDDWDWYTFGYQDLSPLTQNSFTQFDSQFASNLCGGALQTFPNNPTLVCIASLDAALESMVSTTDLNTFLSDSYQAFNILGQHAADLPMYTLAVRTAALRTVANPVNQIGIGYENPAAFLVAHKSSYTPVDSRFQFNGGGPSDTIRWGQAGGGLVTFLNPYNAQFVWEFNVLLEVYDTLFSSSPIAPTNIFCGICSSVGPNPGGFTTSVDGNGNTHFLIELRQNLRWQDGVPMDAFDVKFSILTERDFAAVLGQSVALVQQVTVLSPTELDVQMKGASLVHPLNLGGTLIVPRHIWELAGDHTYGDVGTLDPTKLDTAYDPVASGTFIGSSLFECKSRFSSDLGKIGTGCVTNSDGTRGGQAIGPGGSIFLTVFDNTATSTDPFNQWFRLNNPSWGTGTGAAAQSGQFQEWSWADQGDNALVTISDLASVGSCSGHTGSSSVNCAYWLRSNFHPSTPNVVSSEVAIVASHLDDTMVAPFSWSGDQSKQPGQTLTNIVPFTP